MVITAMKHAVHCARRQPNKPYGPLEVRTCCSACLLLIAAMHPSRSSSSLIYPFLETRVPSRRSTRPSSTICFERTARKSRSGKTFLF